MHFSHTLKQRHLLLEIRGIPHSADQGDPFGFTREKQGGYDNGYCRRFPVGYGDSSHPSHLRFWLQSVEWTCSLSQGYIYVWEPDNNHIQLKLPWKIAQECALMETDIHSKLPSINGTHQSKNTDWLQVGAFSVINTSLSTVEYPTGKCDAFIARCSCCTRNREDSHLHSAGTGPRRGCVGLFGLILLTQSNGNVTWTTSLGKCNVVNRFAELLIKLSRNMCIQRFLH